MATGVIRQFKGPFSSEYQIPIDGFCRFGISIGEDDFMKLGKDDKSFYFQVKEKNGNAWVTNTIWMGRTYRYETEEQVNSPHISFPQGAPLSTIVDVVY